MTELTEKLSVPQIFVGDEYIGDASVVTAIAHSDLQAKVAGKTVPTDSRLLKPTGPPAAQYPAPPEDNTAVTDADRAKMVTYLTEIATLNKFKDWPTAPRDPMLIVSWLKKRTAAMLDAHRNANGLVAYPRVAKSDEFHRILCALCELRAVRLSDPCFSNEKYKTAFLLNLYNLVIPLCFAAYGIAASSVARLEYFDRCAVDIGGYSFSLNQIESGLLRENRKAPYHFSTPLSDARLIAYGVKKADPRIHFALNCGSKSCPPVKFFTPGGLDEELDVVTAAFCDSNDGIKFNKAGMFVSQIFKWYIVDFGGSDAPLAAFLLSHTTNAAKKKGLQEVADGKGKFKFMRYDWDTDAENPDQCKYKAKSCCMIL